MTTIIGLNNYCVQLAVVDSVVNKMAVVVVVRKEHQQIVQAKLVDKFADELADWEMDKSVQVLVVVVVYPLFKFTI